MQTSTMAKIILAEDDDDMRRFLVKALEKAGHHVTAFGEGASAFEEIKQATFDLLLTDIEMPEMDGIEAMKIIRDHCSELAKPYFVALTANAIAGDRENYLKAGMDNYVSKPIDLAELIGALRASWQARARRQQGRVL